MIGQYFSRATTCADDDVSPGLWGRDWAGGHGPCLRHDYLVHAALGNIVDRYFRKRTPQAFCQQPHSLDFMHGMAPLAQSLEPCPLGEVLHRQDGDICGIESSPAAPCLSSCLFHSISYRNDGDRCVSMDHNSFLRILTLPQDVRRTHAMDACLRCPDSHWCGRG